MIINLKLVNKRSVRNKPIILIWWYQYDRYYIKREMELLKIIDTIIIWRTPEQLK